MTDVVWDEAISFPSQVSSAAPHPFWVSVAERNLYQSTTTRGRQYELDTVNAGEYHPTFDNRDGHLSPANPGSPWYPNVTPFRPLRRRAQYPGTVNLLTANQASAGEAVATDGVDGPIPTGTLLTAANTLTGVQPLQMVSADSGATVTTDPAAWQGTQVFQATYTSGSSWTTVFGLNGATVRPSVEHTFSAYARVTGATANVSVNAVLGWADAAGVSLTANTGGTVTLNSTTRAWQRVTVTATPPSDAAGMEMQLAFAAPPTSAGFLQADGLQLEYAPAASTWVKPSTWYPIFTGWVERWPETFTDQGVWTQSQPVVVDSFGYLSQQILKPAFYADVLALKPTFFYPLDEGAGATYAVDLTQNRGPAPVANSIYGPGKLTFGNSVQATTPASASNIAGGGFLGGGSQVVTIDNPLSYSNVNYAGTYLDIYAGSHTGPTVGNPGIAGYQNNLGFTRILAFRTTVATLASNYQVIWGWGQPSYAYPYGGTDGIYLAAGTINQIVTLSSGYQGVSVAGVDAFDGDWHFAAFMFNTGNNYVTLFVDGIGSNVATANNATLGDHTASDAVGLQYTVGANKFNYGFQGDVAFVAEFPGMLTIATLNNLYTSWRQAWSGETSAQRYNRILGWAAYQGTADVTAAPASVDYGPASDLTQGGSSGGIYSPTGGTDAQTALQTVVDTENGQHYVGADGNIRFLSRSARYGVHTPALTFGYDVGAGEIPYEQVGFDYDTTHVANDSQVTQFATQAIYEAFNPTSQDLYGTRTLTRTVNSLDPHECTAAAEFFSYRYGDPDLRVTTIRVHPTAYPAMWAQVLALELGTRVRVKRRTPAQTISWDGFVEQLNWTFDNEHGDHFLDLQISPADKLAFWQLAALHTTTQTQATAAQATVVLDPLADAANLPFTASVNAGLKLTLEPGTAREETLTVASVSGGTVPSYTSVTVTFTANLTYTHAAGSVVCEALPAGDIDPTYWDASSVLGTSTTVGY